MTIKQIAQLDCTISNNKQKLFAAGNKVCKSSDPYTIDKVYRKLIQKTGCRVGCVFTSVDPKDRTCDVIHNVYMYTSVDNPIYYTALDFKEALYKAILILFVLYKKERAK